MRLIAIAIVFCGGVALTFGYDFASLLGLLIVLGAGVLFLFEYARELQS